MEAFAAARSAFAEVDTIEWLGWCAALATLATFSMRTMVPLRLTAVLSNVLFIGYGAFAGIYQVLVLHLVLLPFNLVRLAQMRRLIAQAKKAANGEFDLGWFEQISNSKRLQAGTTIFSKGDRADYLYCVADGRVALSEIGVTVSKCEIIGEIAFFSPNGRRTQSAVCETDCRLLYIDQNTLRQICFQNPTFSYYLTNLIAARLSRDLERISGRTAR